MCHFLFLLWNIKSSTYGYQQDNNDNFILPFQDRFYFRNNNNQSTKKETIFTNDCVHGTLRNVCVDVEKLELMMSNEQIKKKIIIRKLTGKKPPQARGERENGV